MKPALVLLVAACLFASGCGYRDHKKNPGPKTEAARDEYVKYYSEQVVALARTEESAEAAARVVCIRCQPLVRAVVTAMEEERYNPWFIQGFREADREPRAMSDILELREEWMRQGADAARREQGR